MVNNNLWDVIDDMALEIDKSSVYIINLISGQNQGRFFVNIGIEKMSHTL